MHFTSRSIIFLFILSTLAVFFFGFNAGKYISNVQMPPAKLVLSPTLTSNMQLSGTPAPKSSSFSRTAVADCGVSFLLPGELKKTISASQEAEFKNETETVVVNCKKEFVTSMQVELTEKTTSSSALIAGQKSLVFASEGASIFIFPYKKKQNIFIQVSETLEDLIKDTLLIN